MATIGSEAIIKLLAGEGVSSSLTSPNYDVFIEEAEGMLFAETRINFVDVYSSLDDDVKGSVESAVNTWAAMSAVNYSVTGYISLSRIQTLLDFLSYKYERAVSLLKEKFVSNAIQAA